MLMTLLQANYLGLFNWVLTTSAKASIFIVFLLGIKYVLRHRMGARLQYMLWSVLIIGLILPWAPSSPVSINNLVNASYIQQIVALSSRGTTQPTATVVDNKQSSFEQTAVVNSNPSKAVLGTDTQLTGNRNNVAPFAIFPFIYKVIFLIWLVGILLLTAITILVNIRFSHKIEHNLVTDQRLITVFNQLKVELKIKTEIPLVKTRHVNSPSLLGFIHPRLLLPLGIEQTFSVEQIRHIFLHELLHFRRKDIMTNWLTQVLVIIHWFNPLMWYAFYRMREDQEIACDALAMERIDTEQSNDYAYTLIKLVETYSNAPRLAGLASLSGSNSQIKRRLTMIKDSRRGSVKWSVLGLLVIALIATAVFTSVKGLPNYHIPVNQSDIKEIRISIDGTEKKIPAKDWSFIIQEFNNSKITRVQNLDVNHDLVVLFAFNDGSGRTLNFAVNGNEIRVSRHIGDTKVDYIAENSKIKTLVTKLYEFADMSTIGIPEIVNVPTTSQAEKEAPVMDDVRLETYNAGIRANQERLPKVHILYENKEIAWLLGYSVFTGKAKVNPILGNGSFGWVYADILATKGTNIKPKGKLEVSADEVQGLEKPIIGVRQYMNSFAGTDYPIEGNVVVAPNKPGVYIFEIHVDWSKGGQNSINYLFKVIVE